MDIKDLIGYNHQVRELYFEAFAKLPWSDVAAPRGLSFDSMRNVFVHITFVEDRWINYAIPGRFKEWVDPEFDSFRSMETLKKYMQQTKANTEKYLATLAPDELSRQITVPWGTNPDTKISVEKCLTHMVLEDMIHYGELSAALWQMGQEAPYMGFWRFKLKNP
jgi:uncharacterized damage-inducible protein DinB